MAGNLAFSIDQISLFAKLPRSSTEDMLKQGLQAVFPPGTLLMREGEPSQTLLFISAGEVVILKGDVEIDRQGAGGLLGEMGALTGQPRTASVRCLTEVTALTVPVSVFLEEMNKHPMLLRTLICALIEKMEGTQHFRTRQASAIQSARDMFSRCVSAEVLDLVLERQSPEELLEGQLTEAAILFFDIQGFSSAAETTSPKVLLKALNKHLSIVTEAVAAVNGTVVNFIGDALLAVFNCPLPVRNPAGAALECFLHAQKGISRLHQDAEFAGLPRFRFGAGINWGTLVSGAIGSQDRFSFSVLGDEVNLAARLEGLTRHYPVEIIMSGSAHAQLPSEFQARCLQFDVVQVKGRANPVSLFTLTDLPADQRSAFRDAHSHYVAGRFSEAESIFKSIDWPLAHYLSGRCAELKHWSTPWPGFYSWSVK